MQTREITSQARADFLEAFSRRHENWLVELKTFDRESSKEISSRDMRLKSISAEPKGENQGEMIVIVCDDEITELSQLIRNPSGVIVTITEAGAEESLEIYSEQLLVVVKFRSAVLPELVDGVA